MRALGVGLDIANYPAPGAAPPALPVHPSERPQVFIAGVTGGVGARTLARLLTPHCPVDTCFLTEPLQTADVLVANITAAATAWLPVALGHLNATPVLAVVHTVPGPVPPATRTRLRAARPHVRQTVHLPHTPGWTAIETPPAEVLPRAARARDRLLSAVATTPHGRT